MLFRKRVSLRSLFVLLLCSIIFIAGCMSADNRTPSGQDSTSGSGQDAQEAPSQGTSDSGLLAAKETTIDILMEEHASFPVKPFEQSPFLQHIFEKTNIKLNIIPVPDSGDAYAQKLNIMLNTNDLPDVIWNTKNDSNINSAALKGMFLSYDDYLDELPNIRKALEDHPDIRKTIAAEDGKLYIMPRIMFDNMTELFIFRKDILEKENIAEPKTFEELTEVFRILKQKYPDHIIWVNRWGSEHLLNRLAYSWGTGYEPATHGFYLNRDTDRYQYGPLDPEFKELVLWLKQMFDEGILDKEYALRTTQQWEEAFFNEQALFAIDFIARIEQINNNYLEQNSTARVAAIAPPAGPTGRSGIHGRSSVLPNSGIAVSANAKDPLAAFKFIDWIYGDEGRYIARYGIEGETYTVNEDGTVTLTPHMKSQANPGGKDLVTDYGWVYYLNKYEFPVGHVKEYGVEDQDENLYMYSRRVMEEAGGVIEPDPTLRYTEAQEDVRREKGTAVMDHFKENIDKFIMGTRPMEEWEMFLEELKKRGLADLEKVYNDAYQAYANN